MSFSILLWIYTIHLFSLLNAQCSWSGLDLTAIEGANIQCAFEYDATQLLLQYSACQSNLQCSILDLDTYMVLQNSSSGNCTTIAKIDESITPQQTTVDGQNAYKFSYANGGSSFQCGNSRKLDLTFVCDPTVATFDIDKLICGKTAMCEYYLTIYTKLACNVCLEENDCSGNGWCVNDTEVTEWSCECYKGWTTHPNINEQDDEPQYCNYEQKEQTTAFLLSLFLGIFGAGRWYCGQWITAGIKMVLSMFWCFSLCVVACIFGCDECLKCISWSFTSDKGRESNDTWKFIAAASISIVWIVTDWFLFGLNKIPDENGVSLSPW